MAQTGVPSWSQTSSSNATADGTVNWAEGQSPSSVNDSARAMMAGIAKWRDDLAGGLAATGTASAYVLTSNTVFFNAAGKHFQEISFLPPATNAAGVTLNLDGLGALPIVGTDGAAIPAGTMLANGVYTLFMNDTEFILKGFFGNPYNIPIGGMMDYIGTTVPNSNFAFPIGQAISRTTYATLFALTSTTYGVGDGSTTFNVPDLTGRISAMKEASATRLTTAGGGVDGGTLGAVGGTQNITLLTANLPAYTPAGSIAVTGTVPFASPTAYNNTFAGGVQNIAQLIGATAIAITGQTFTGTAQGGTSTAVKIVQPTIVLNKILRLI